MKAQMEIPVIFENDDICVINKPSGLAVQGGSGVSSSVDTLLTEQRGAKAYLVHRLDKDTAGLLITAKNSAAAAVWTKLISSHLVTKRYCALCTGTFTSQKGRIDDPVVHKGNAKGAETFFSLRRQADIEAGGMRLCFSLVDLTLGTGRMHQIRIHLAGQKTPIAGDDKYGDFKLNRFLRKTFGIKKMHLAALRLDFSEQCIGSAFVPPYLEAPFPGFMSETLVRLGFGT